MSVVEEGVANFRDFQTVVREFIVRADERARIEDELDKKRSRIHYRWLALLSALIVAGFSAILSWAISFESRHKSVVQHDQSSIQQQFNAKDQ